MTAATSAGGSCFACPSYTGAPAGCAGSCPLCVNAVNNYVAACAGNSSALGYNQMTAFADALSPLADCFDVITLASFALVKTCSDAFDVVVTYTEARPIIPVFFSCRMARSLPRLPAG